MDNYHAYMLSEHIKRLIEAMGMQAENKAREIRGESLAYDEQAFLNLVHKPLDY